MKLVTWFLDRFGLFASLIMAALLLLVLYLALSLAWSHLFGWWHARSNANLKADLHEAKAEIAVARHDEAQVVFSSKVTTATVAAQDKHASDQRAATAQIVEVIHERIVQKPVVVPVSDDPVVRAAANQARARAQAAVDRLQGAPGD
jgi:hypothetical protein